MKITEGLDNFDSLDSYFIDVFVAGNHLMVPYSNLGVSDHPDLNQGETAYISKAFLSVQNLSYLKVGDKVIFGERPPFGDKVWFFGGINLNGEGGIEEYEFGKGDISILLPEDAKVSDFQFPRPDPGDTAMQDHFFLTNTGFPEISEVQGWVPALFEK